jgi:hypothetical protein
MDSFEFVIPGSVLVYHIRFTGPYEYGYLMVTVFLVEEDSNLSRLRGYSCPLSAFPYVSGEKERTRRLILEGISQREDRLVQAIAA